jgi:hypothetical protein
VGNRWNTVSGLGIKRRSARRHVQEVHTAESIMSGLEQRLTWRSRSRLSDYVRCAVRAVTSRVTVMSGVMGVVMVAVVSAVAVRVYTPLSSS